MARLIDADKLDYTCNADECGMLTGCNHCQYNIITEDEIDNAPTVEAIPKADYENRLKADLKAMLEDLDLRLEEMENPFSTRVSGCSKDGWEHGVKNSRFLIKEEINALKENENGNDDR